MHLLLKKVCTFRELNSLSIFRIHCLTLQSFIASLKFILLSFEFIYLFLPFFHYSFLFSFRISKLFFEFIHSFFPSIFIFLRGNFLIILYALFQ